MVKLAPKLDQRTAKEIAEQVQVLLEEYTGNDQSLQGTRAALVNIFARFAEIIIERLNQVPDKNFLAFLDLLGASRLPPQPARVPLTFALTGGTTVDAVVPKGTQVAAPPAEGEKDPVIFETERELVVTAVKLDGILVRDPQQDRWSDHSLMINQENSSGFEAFRGSDRIEHILYIKQDSLFNNSALEEIRLNFQIAELAGDIPDRIVQWEIWDSNTEISFSPQLEQDETSPRILDETANLINSGNITFSRLRSSFAEPQHLLNNRWLRCRLLTPITSAIEPHLPQVTNLTIQGKFNYQTLKVQNALTNQVSLDLNQPFFPFGEKPRFGDTLYLDLAEHKAFTKDGTIELQVGDPLVVAPVEHGTTCSNNHPQSNCVSIGKPT